MKHQAHQLSPTATTASHVRYRIAQALAEACPLALGQEILVAGSVARGLADAYSDIEQIFYVQDMPPVQKRDAWLRRIGATAIIHDATPLEDHSHWSTFRFQGIWVEAGWQTLSAHETLLGQIVTGQITDHSRLILAEVTIHALPLRSEGYLARWQHQLAQYPPPLAEKLITEAVDLWRFPHLLDARWAAIHRQEPLRLSELLVRDLHHLLRVLFAINQQWEPEWKWISHLETTLEMKPDHLLERMATILPSGDPTRSVIACLELIRDMLMLLPPHQEILQARAAVGKCLSNGYLDEA